MFQYAPFWMQNVRLRIPVSITFPACNDPLFMLLGLVKPEIHIHHVQDERNGIWPILDEFSKIATSIIDTFGELMLVSSVVKLIINLHFTFP